MNMKDCVLPLREAYLQDITVADTAITGAHFQVSPKDVLLDFYALPSRNHQTMFVKLCKVWGEYRMVFAKAIQNSIWFSDRIYMYRFYEALSVADHPIRKGRIVCGEQVLDNSLAAVFLATARSFVAPHPDTRLEQNIDAVFQAIRLYDNGELANEVIYTNSGELSFKPGCRENELIPFFSTLYINMESIIGIGDGN